MYRPPTESITALAHPNSPPISHPVVNDSIIAPQVHPGEEQRVKLDEPALIPLVPQVDILSPPVLHPTPPFDPLPDNVPLLLPLGRAATIPTAPPSHVTRQHSARLRGFAFASLNPANDNSPLTYTKAKTGPDAPQWLKAESEEFDRLFESHTMQPIHLERQPYDRRSNTTYFNPQTKQKTDTAGSIIFRIRGTAGGDRINYHGPTSAQTAAMAVVELLIHSVVSEKKHWMTIDIKDYYLGTPLLRPEYIRIPTRMIPSSTMTKHKLNTYLNKNSVLFEINKGMYGLPQAGLLAQQRLIAHLAQHGYHETATLCLFRHASNGTAFTLVVDDFGVKYATPEGAQHLIHTLRLLYVITIDWSGATYIVFTIKFNKQEQSVSVTMPGYIDKVLQRFAPTLENGASSPAIYLPPAYNSTDHSVKFDSSALLPPSEVKTLQEQVGRLLYYARGVDATILPAVNHIASLQSTPTRAVKAAMTRLLQ